MRGCRTVYSADGTLSSGFRMRNSGAWADSAIAIDGDGYARKHIHPHEPVWMLPPKRKHPSGGRGRCIYHASSVMDEIRKPMRFAVTAVSVEKRTHLLAKASGTVSPANWHRAARQVAVGRNDARNRNDNNGARSVVRAYAFCDLSQPPSIRPISASLAWVWKIRVSFASLSSRRSRSFSVVNSR